MSDTTPTEDGLGRSDRTRRTVLKTLAASGITLGAIGFAGTAAADPDTAIIRQTDDLTGQEIENECTGELMYITKGTAQEIYQDFHIGTDGCRYHFNLHNKLNGFAVGQSTGLTYRLNGAGIFTFDIDVCGDEETGTGTQTTHINWIGLGDAPDFVSTVLFKITITPNGDFVVEREFQQIKCDDYA